MAAFAGVDVPALLVRVGVDIVIVVAWSALVGATAPRWPDRWLRRDRGPLRLTRWDTVARYRALGVPRLTRLLPEGGAWLGGASKRRLPGADVAALEAYLVEVRRAEWVHWLSMLAAVPVMVVGPWWLGLAFAVVVAAVNAAFLVVLRHNRVRLLAVLARAARRAVGGPPTADGGSAPDPTPEPPRH